MVEAASEGSWLDPANGLCFAYLLFPLLMVGAGISFSSLLDPGLTMFPERVNVTKMD